MASPGPRPSRSPQPPQHFSGRGFRELSVGSCDIQTPGDRYDDPTAAQVLRDRITAASQSQATDWMDSDSEDDIIQQVPDQITTENPWTEPGPPPLEQRIPTTQNHRNNLTAMSQRYNLYFAAYGNRIFIYRTRSSRILLAGEPDLILATSPDAIAQRITPSQDNKYPHQSNTMRTGFLGNKEILALVYDDGSVFAYYVDAIAAYLERLPGSRLPGVPTPFFKENAGSSAWGLAIHQTSRLIAVSTNRREVVVFAFGLTHHAVSPAMAALSTVAARFACRRSRSCRIVLLLGANGHNIPNISFLDNRDGAAEKICAMDIHGNTWILDIWRSFYPPVRISPLQDGTGGTGWDVLVLPHTSFVAATGTDDALGLSPKKLRHVNGKVDITAGLSAVPDNPATTDSAPVWLFPAPAPPPPEPEPVPGQVTFAGPQGSVLAQHAIPLSLAEAANEEDIGEFEIVSDSDDPDGPENPMQHYNLSSSISSLGMAPALTPPSLQTPTAGVATGANWGALFPPSGGGGGGGGGGGNYLPLPPVNVPPGIHELPISFQEPFHPYTYPQQDPFVFPSQPVAHYNLMPGQGHAPAPAPAAAPPSPPSPVSGSPPFPPGLRTILPPTPPAPVLDDAEYFRILDAFPEDLVYLPHRGAILGFPSSRYDRLRFFQRRQEHLPSKTPQDLTADRINRCAILRTYDEDIELISLQPGLCNVMCRKAAGRPERPGTHRMATHRLNMTLHVPELSLVIIGSPLGRVILLTPTRIKGDAVPLNTSRSGLKYGFRVDCVLPRASEERDRRLPRRNLLYGIAVAPAPEPAVDTIGKGSLRLRQPGSRRKTALGPGASKHRLVLHFHSHIIITYDLSRDDDGALRVF
ncbi:hypothetical protein F5X68DRAFT_204878 [Plectosphaerella plurivora]|uniref:Uncharacterized protein n=1 Tax=Plectosphaerella plurivora TaxID=936078 RepID=A0A9P8VEA2_9PEZI|nr:hypothetical protein F5X68DRAFT_204878 [Plectosphaerella plurivora]